jgi:hypothetical protein
MNKKLYPLFALFALALASLACTDGINVNNCDNVLSADYDTQECQNVRNLAGDYADPQLCTAWLSDVYSTPACKQYRIDNPPTDNEYNDLLDLTNDCDTCQTAISGGEVMDDENIVSTFVEAVSCSNPDDPAYYTDACVAYQIANP